MARHLALLGALALALAATAGCRTGGPGFSGPDILYVATPDLVGVEMLRLAGVTSGDDVNLRLRPRLLRELRPGTRIVSHDFGMADWRPDRVQRVRGPDREHTIYYWLVPTDVAGTWRATLRPAEGPKAAVIELHQRFQRGSGTLDLDGRRLPIEGRLAGGPPSLTAEGLAFTARIQGGPSAGRFAEPGGRAGEWSARRQTSR